MDPTPARGPSTCTSRRAGAWRCYRGRPWCDLVRKLWPDEAEHLFDYFAHRVQHPDEKINHALVLGGPPGIGKDTMLEPVK